MELPLQLGLAFRQILDCFQHAEFITDRHFCPFIFYPILVPCIKFCLPRHQPLLDCMYVSSHARCFLLSISNL